MLVETGKNAAGYPEYARTELFPAENEKMNPPSRRRFLKLLGGGLGSAALGVVALDHIESGSSSEDAKNTVDAPTAPALVQQEKKEAAPTAPETFSDSHYFNMALAAYAQEYGKEIPAVLAFAQKITKGDERQRSRVAYLQEMLTVPNVPEEIERELSKLIPGLGFVESRYDASEVSGEGARGILQILPATWQELGNPDEDILSLADQTRVAGEVFSRSYAYIARECENELSVIRSEFFNGEESDFLRFFMTPVLLNAYNAGMGSMKQLIRWFVRCYGSEAQIVGALNQAEGLSGYDVFYAMTRRGLSDAPVSAYKKYASEYAVRIYGARQCLDSQTDTSA